MFNASLPCKCLALILALGPVAGARDGIPPAQKHPALAAQAAQTGMAKRAGKGPQTDLNSAAKADLMKLPGITSTYAEKIIAGRPYKSKADVISHHILPPEFYAPLKDRIMVMPPKAARH